MRVLSIEDDPAMARSIKHMLEAEGFNVYTSDLGEEGISLARLDDYDVVLLDYKLPDMTGLEVLAAIRNANVTTPIIMVTHNSLTDTKVKAFDLGVDDYLTKPFHKDELIVRIRAVVRRSRGYAHNRITTGRLEVDLGGKIAKVDGTNIHLTCREYQMLEVLSLRKGLVVSKSCFMNQLYGEIDEPDPEIVNAYIAKLRKKIAGATGDDSYIQTVYGRGHVLLDPEQALRSC